MYPYIFLLVLIRGRGRGFEWKKDISMLSPPQHNYKTVARK